MDKLDGVLAEGADSSSEETSAIIAPGNIQSEGVSALVLSLFSHIF